MLKNFRCYQMAKKLYSLCIKLSVKGPARDQLHRASLSVMLNLAEGSGRFTKKEQRRFYIMAFASLRETQALLEMGSYRLCQEIADSLAGSIFKLIRYLEAG
jgi:four helix bundle protein